MNTSTLSQMSPTSTQAVPPYQRKLLEENAWRASPSAHLQAGPLTPQMECMPPLSRRSRNVKNTRHAAGVARAMSQVKPASARASPSLPDKENRRQIQATVAQTSPAPSVSAYASPCVTPRTERARNQLDVLRGQMQANAECLVALEGKLVMLAAQGQATKESPEARAIRKEVKQRSKEMDALEAKILGMLSATQAMDSPCGATTPGPRGRAAPMSPLTPLPQRLQPRHGKFVPATLSPQPSPVAGPAAGLEAKLEASQHKSLDIADRMLLRLRARVDSIKPSQRKLSSTAATAARAANSPETPAATSKNTVVDSPRLQAARAEAEKLRQKVLRLERRTKRVCVASCCAYALRLVVFVAASGERTRSSLPNLPVLRLRGKRRRSKRTTRASKS